MNKRSPEYKALRQKFNAYFADLQDDARADGYSVSRSEEWDRFVAAHLEELADNS